MCDLAEKSHRKELHLTILGEFQSLSCTSDLSCFITRDFHISDPINHWLRDAPGRISRLQ